MASLSLAPDVIAPWDTPAPERDVRPNLWAQLPEDLAPHVVGGTPAHAFAQIMRPGTWVDGKPALGRRAHAIWDAFESSLPTITQRVLSEDGATKCVLTTSDGHKIEAVHMPRAVKNPRVTLCISSQVGCAMGCTFCATGSMGIVRNLTAGEIVGQVMALMDDLGPKRGQDVSVVFMGMGEPLHNLKHVHRAIQILCDERGLGMSARRITVSTSGIVTKIDALAKLSPRPRLAVSVNATLDAIREQTMPVARRWNLAELRASLERFPASKRDSILLEYVLLAGVNDTDDDARRLATFAEGLHAKINVIPMNEHDASTFLRPADKQRTAFVQTLLDAGAMVFVRNSRGRDVGGACGQLVQ